MHPCRQIIPPCLPPGLCSPSMLSSRSTHHVSSGTGSSFLTRHKYSKTETFYLQHLARYLVNRRQSASIRGMRDQANPQVYRQAQGSAHSSKLPTNVSHHYSRPPWSLLCALILPMPLNSTSSPPSLLLSLFHVSLCTQAPIRQ